jgi:transcriptional regulator with XRE-family HTH domain
VAKPEEILKLARENKGFTQEALAAMVDISGRMLQRYEEGSFPKFKSANIEKLDQVLGTNLYELLYDRKVQVNGSVNNHRVIMENPIQDRTEKLISTLERQIDLLMQENKRLRDERDASSLELTKVVLVNTALLRTVLDCQALLRSKALKEPEKEALLQIDKLKAVHLRKIQEEHKIDL